MKYDPRKGEPAFPALPEKEAITAATPPVPSAPPPTSALAELSMRYEREVFDLVRNSLDQGQSEKKIVAALVQNDFAEDEARTIMQAVIEDRKSLGDSVEREMFDFVSEHLNKGTDEAVLIPMVCEFGVKSDFALAFIRSVSAANLEHNFEPDVLHLVAGLEGQGDSPHQMVDELAKHGFTEDEAWRLLGDREAMKAEIEDGERAMHKATRIMSICVVAGILLIFLMVIFVAYGAYINASRVHALNKRRVEFARNLLYPPLPSGGA